jgi:site-specific recombinase XerD
MKGGSFTIQHTIQKTLAQIGLASKQYTVYTIRHSFATHLVDNGTDLHTVKELLGHSTLQTTMRYMHLSSKRMKGVVNPYHILMNVQNNKEHHQTNKH